MREKLSGWAALYFVGTVCGIMATVGWASDGNWVMAALLATCTVVNFIGLVGEL